MSERHVCDNCDNTDDDYEIQECPFCSDTDLEYCGDCWQDHISEDHVDDLFEFWDENKDRVEEMKRKESEIKNE